MEYILKHKIAQLLEQAALEAQQRGLLPQVALPEIAVEHPAITVYGDYACNFPLKLARIAGANPLDIAKKMTKLIPPIPEVEKIEVASPGFINFTLRRDWLTQQVEVILQAGEAYGDLDMGRGSRAQLEFVSVNPTGPLHVGHGRGAVLGSTLANVLTAAGYGVEKEYYINDMGNQIATFGRSLYARYQQCLGKEAVVPSDGYHGNYMIDLVKEIFEGQGDKFLSLPESEAASQLGEVGVARMMQRIKQDLELLNVAFDIWF